MSSGNMIEIKGLRKSFKKLKVLNGIDISVKKGTILALLGPNGAGKTTTIRILSTLMVPDKGVVRIGGLDVVRDADKVKSLIGLTGQYAAVDEYLTGRENLEMMGRLYHLRMEDIKRRSQELLVQLELLDAAERPVKTYSGGMRRRLDLAASLIAHPPVIFLDEPTTGLDPPSRLAIWDLIKKLVMEGTTILLTTQHMEEADELADRIVVIDGGTVIAEGTSDELKQRVGTDMLEITLVKASDFRLAKKALRVKEAHWDEARRAMSIATSGGVKHMKEILSRLEAARIDVDDISLHRPTLDDVFLNLTGHATQKGGNDNG